MRKRSVKEIQSDLNRAKAQYRAAYDSTLFKGKQLQDVAKRYLSHIDKYEQELEEVSAMEAAKEIEVINPEIVTP